MQKKYLLFDHDGVLVETEYWYFRANQRALSELGFKLSLELHLEYMKQGYSFSDLEALIRLDPDVVSSKHRDRNRYYQTYLQNEDIEIKGVQSVLERLSTHYKMAIVTTSRPQDFKLIHKNRPLVYSMDFVLTREDYIKAKPDPEPYLTALERFRGTREEAIVIEDSERGLRSAIAAGIDCVIVHNEFTRSHDFSKAQHQIQTLAELPALLSSL